MKITHILTKTTVNENTLDDADPVQKKTDEIKQRLLDKMGKRFGLPPGCTAEQVRAAQQEYLDKNDPAAAEQYKQNMDKIDAGGTHAANSPVQLAPTRAPVAEGPEYIDTMMNNYAASIGQPVKRAPGVNDKGLTQAQWVKLVKTKFPTAKIQQTKMIDGPMTAILDDGRKLSWKKVEQGVAENNGQMAKFDPASGLPVGNQLSELEGDATQFSTPTQSTPTTEQPPRRGYSIHLIKAPGANGANYQAKDAWHALATVFPRDYPPVDNYGNGPAQRKVYEVVKNGSAVVKSGISSEDIAETMVSKLVRLGVPDDCWEVTSEDLNESQSAELKSLLKSAGISQNK